MGLALVTGSSGLIGSEAVETLISVGFRVIGIDNDLRSLFFGKDASTAWNRDRLLKKYPTEFASYPLDIRDYDTLETVFAKQMFDLVVHTAAQPSHDWAARDPLMDFSVNANGTLNLLELTRRFSPSANFVLLSTNKVYGNQPNSLPFIELSTRWELPKDSAYYHGIEETFSIDQSMHSIFGASKVSADILTQEYGRYFGMNTLILRGGCLTGPMHSSSQLHGFLSHLVKSYVKRDRYTVFGYKGKQVRDNIHAKDVVDLILKYHSHPHPALVLNIGGGRENSISILEAIDKLERLGGDRNLDIVYDEKPRRGDHIWYVSNLSKAKHFYPDWKLTYGIDDLITEMYEVASKHTHN